MQNLDQIFGDSGAGLFNTIKKKVHDDDDIDNEESDNIFNALIKLANQQKSSRKNMMQRRKQNQRKTIKMIEIAKSKQELGEIGGEGGGGGDGGGEDGYGKEDIDTDL